MFEAVSAHWHRRETEPAVTLLLPGVALMVAEHYRALIAGRVPFELAEALTTAYQEHLLGIAQLPIPDAHLFRVPED